MQESLSYPNVAELPELELEDIREALR